MSCNINAIVIISYHRCGFVTTLITLLSGVVIFSEGQKNKTKKTPLLLCILSRCLSISQYEGSNRDRSFPSASLYFVWETGKGSGVEGAGITSEGWKMTDNGELKERMWQSEMRWCAAAVIHQVPPASTSMPLSL